MKFSRANPLLLSRPRNRTRAGSCARTDLIAGVLLVLAAGGPASAQAPFSFDSAFGRLPKSVVPVDYEISIVPDAQHLILSGRESVALDFRQASATIVFNSLNETLNQVRFDGRPVESASSDDKLQLTTVTLAKPARPGRHTLTFSYRGKIETSPQGLFAQPYVAPGGAKGLLLSTQFEATDARRMFPCWDEPAFRATFRLTADIPAEWAAVSNMPIERRVVHGPLARVSFERTPKMPSYLLEFSAGELAQLTGAQGRTRVGVWAVRGQEKDAAAALANARQILGDYNDYFAIPFPLPKLDSIAVPGGFDGAMENWGAITYNDQVLLVTPSATAADRQEVYSVQAHEMAHQWFGDLVTMGWWDDIWLNESFASWMAAKETARRHPSWNWWESEDGSKEAAMSADARVASHPIQAHVTNELEALSSFDFQITYQKGEAVLRMLEAYMGPKVFRDGLRAYMKAHAYSNATTTDLWNALSAASAHDIGVIASSWTAQAGFPVITVTASCAADDARTISLSQKRFLLSGAERTPSHWNIPLQIRSGADRKPEARLLTKDGQSIPAGRCSEPLSINAGASGYYRARYDETTLRAITRDFGTLPKGDRIALLDDQWALVTAGVQELPTYLALVSAEGARLEERPWTQIATALATIEYGERGTTGHEGFAAYARSLIRPVADELGWKSKPGDTGGIRKLRRTVLTDLGDWDDAQVIAEARSRFAAFAADRSKIEADDQEAVLSIVARHADAAAFEQLHAVAKSARNETELRRYYGALMRVRDERLAAEAAAIALTEEIPKQAATARLELVVALADQHPQLAWKTFTEHYDALTSPFGPYGSLFIAQNVLASFWDSLPPDQLEAWVNAHVPPEMLPMAARSLEIVRFKLAEKTALVRAADKYLTSRQAAGSTLAPRPSRPST